LLVSLEDDYWELQRRIQATLDFYKIPRSDLKGWLNADRKPPRAARRDVDLGAVQADIVIELGAPRAQTSKTASTAPSLDEAERSHRQPLRHGNIRGREPRRLGAVDPHRGALRRKSSAQFECR
jgi:hypothetical protein